MRELTIVFFDAGGGHRNAAEALKSKLQTQAHPWYVRLMNLQERLDPIDLVRRTTGLRIQDTYNQILRKGWTRPTPYLLVLLRAAIQLRHRRIVSLLEQHWRQHSADVVLSVIPLFNRAIAESLRNTAPDTAFATLLTDFADFPPHFWMEQESEFLICGTEHAQEQALRMGHSHERVFRTSGMILKPSFYEERSIDVASERKQLGLEPLMPTGIVLFGGHGAPVMTEIAGKLQECADDLQLIMICGHNQRLREDLRKLRQRKPMLVEGFTPDVAYYMRLADFFIGKPGPGSISEALKCRLPVIIERNSKTIPQERYNAQWVTEKGMGIVLDDFENIAAGVHRLLDPATFHSVRENVLSYSNRALFEVPSILDEVLERHVPSSVLAVPRITLRLEHSVKTLAGRV